MEFALSRCINPNCKKAPYSYTHILSNKLTLTIRKHIQLYYAVSRNESRVFVSLKLRLFCRDGWFARIRAALRGLDACRSSWLAPIPPASLAKTATWVKRYQSCNTSFPCRTLIHLSFQYNEFDLYTQLCFYQHIFDAKRAMSLFAPAEKGIKRVYVLNK